MSPIKKALKTNDSAVWLALVRIFIGYIWLESAIGKIQGGTFVDGLAKTLTNFAAKNPIPWQVDFLNNVAIPNATLFGTVTMYGELLVGLALFLGVFSQVGALGGLIMNVAFYFAAGHTSASTETVNLVMAGVQVVLLLSGAGKVLSIEQLVYDRLPKLPWWPKRLAQVPEAA